MIKTLNIKHLLAEQEIAQKRSNKVPLGLKDCMEFHMISFHPSDSVQIRLMCLCDDECLGRDFIDCWNSKTLFFNQLYLKRGYFDSSDDDCEYEDHNLTNEDGNEVYILRVDYCC